MSKAPNQVGTNTTTTSSAPPSYVADAQQNLLGTAQYLTAPFTQSAPNYMVAGFTPDQEMGFDLARYQAEQSFSNPLGGSITDFGSYTAPYAYNDGPPGTPDTYTASPASMNASLVNQGSINQVNASPYLINPNNVSQANAAQSAAAQLTADGDIRPLFNPYQQDVVGTTTQQLEEANARQLAAIRARQGAESAYGGNRAALQESEQRRNFGNTLANTVANLNYGGWNTAANLGLQNVGYRQQTGLANQSAQQQANLANAAAQNQISLANQGAQAQAALYNAGALNQGVFSNQSAQQQANAANMQAQQQAALANAAAQNQFAQFRAGQAQQSYLANQANEQATNLFNAQQTLNAATTQNNISNADWQRQMQALQMLLGTGGQQQQLAQTAINAPFTAMNYLGQVTPSQYGTSGTSTQPIYGANTFQTAASLAPLATAAFGAFSDKTMKKDLEKVGKDPRNDLDIYKYRWKGAPPGSPKSVGPMAQQVEKKYPGSTARVGGKLMIKGNARTMLGI